MKELSIEEKARAYDESLGRAKEYLNSPRTCFDIEQLYNIFPGLCESHDERIRKEIIRIVDIWTNSAPVVNGIPSETLLAWLEKQGEKEEEILVLKDQIESLHAAIRAIKETHRIELEKQDEHIDKSLEQKTAWDEEDESMLKGITFDIQSRLKDHPIEQLADIYYKELSWLKSFKDRVQHQQKQSWSVEDENIINRILSNCYDFKTSFKFGSPSAKIVQNDIDKIEPWLKSLKGRVQPQPKQEWDEEDNRKIDELIVLCKGRKKLCSPTVSAYKRMDELKEWLKSLKERYTWKPSDEQMKQLGWVGEQNKDNMIGKELMSLYQDLKKLKGE